MDSQFSGNSTKQIQLKNGQLLIFRRPKPEDASDMIEYLNIVGGESDNLLFGAGDFRLTVAQEAEYIENINKDSNTLMLLGIIDNEVISTAHITCLNRKRIAHNSEFSIVVKKAYWRLGIGSAMMKELIGFAKQHICIRNLSLGVRATNKNAIRLYEKYGFKKIGVHRDYFYIDGNYYDEVLMDLHVK